jgi:hypothetical protein
MPKMMSRFSSSLPSVAQAPRIAHDEVAFPEAPC